MSPKENKQVSAAVRILHQKRDASARATHLKATDGNVPSVTIERKIMSTKTSIKRIALVAASALAIAGFTAVPSQAAQGTASAIVVSKNTLVGGGVALASTAYTASAVLDSRGISSFNVTAGDTVTLALVSVTGTTDVTGDSVTVSLRGYGNLLTNETVSTAAAGGGTWIGTSTVINAAAGIKSNGEGKTFTVTSVAGTYTLDITLNHGADPTHAASSVTTSVTMVVAAASGLSTSISSAYQEAPIGTSVASATTNAVARSGSKTLNTDISQIAVTLNNANSTAHTGASVVTASITGAGFVNVDGTAAAAPAAFNTRVDTHTNTNGTVYVHTQADGTAGTGTITVSVTDVATSATTVLGTFTITSYGSVAALTVHAKNALIGKSGGATTGLATASSDTVTYMPAFVIAAKDSAGQLANASSAPSIVSGTPTVVSSGTCALDNDATYGTGLVGYYGCSFTTASGAKSGDKATLTVRIVDPADATKYLTTTVDVTVGGSTAKEVISFDKASYSAGEAMVVTITATDSSGNPVYDGAASPALTGSKQVGGTLPSASNYVAGKVSTTAGALWAPAIGGDFTVVGTGTDAAATALSATASIEGDASASLALDAANAATDAANNAYDEAQNATQAASDALAAVTALAAQVKSLIASVKKLTAAVAKLKK
jgi:hypothetical protein